MDEITLIRLIDTAIGLVALYFVLDLRRAITRIEYHLLSHEDRLNNLEKKHEPQSTR